VYGEDTAVEGVDLVFWVHPRAFFLGPKPSFFFHVGGNDDELRFAGRMCTFDLEGYREFVEEPAKLSECGIIAVPFINDNARLFFVSVVKSVIFLVIPIGSSSCQFVGEGGLSCAGLSIEDVDSFLSNKGFIEARVN